VSARHRPPVLVDVPQCPRCVVGVPRRRVGGTPPEQVRCHHAPLSTLLLSAVHPVVLTVHTHTQPNTVPLQAESCVASRVQSGTTPSFIPAAYWRGVGAEITGTPDDPGVYPNSATHIVIAVIESDDLLDLPPLDINELRQRVASWFLSAAPRFPRHQLCSDPVRCINHCRWHGHANQCGTIPTSKPTPS
jgi:hypothetical protein